MMTQRNPAPWDESALGPIIERIADHCRKKQLSLGVAESCTGGMIGEMVTGIAGISDIFKGGVISYSNEVKKGILGVSEDDLARVGAVSAEVAKAMAEGACRALDCSVAVSVTGIAGPGGGSDAKPVGTVFEAVCVAGRETVVRRFSFGRERSRAEIRHAAAQAALEFLAEELDKE